MDRSCLDYRAATVTEASTSGTEFDDQESDTEMEDCITIESASESEEDIETDADQKWLEKVARYSAYRVLTDAGAPHFLCSNSGFMWSRTVDRDAVDKRNLFENPVSLRSETLMVKTPLEAWSTLFTDEILSIIVTRTNEEINRIGKTRAEKSGRDKDHHHNVDLVELKALIGLLYYAGMQSVNDLNTRILWSPYGMCMCRLAMPRKRFKFLLKTITFDDRKTRQEREDDRLAKIRDIWEMFVGNCTANYKPHRNCTINEQLLPFRGKCLFRTKKGNETGLKIVTLNDSTTHYMHNAMPCLTNDHDDPNTRHVADFVRQLTEPIYNTGRNITCSNRYISISLCDTLVRYYKLTMVGSFSKKNHEVPEEFKRMPPSEMNAQFAYLEDKTLVSFNSKPNKIMLLLSSLHVDGKIDESTGNPEIVDFYNRTKSSSTNNFDVKCRRYSVARKTRRWTMRYFYGMLDQANVNSLILYGSCKKNAKMKRPHFILDLSLALVSPLVERRLTSPTLEITLRLQIENFLKYKALRRDLNPRHLLGTNRMSQQKICSFCPPKSDKKTQFKCLMCEKPMCRLHTANICGECSAAMIE